MANPSWQYHYLERLSIEELEKLLQLAVDPQSDQEDSEYIDAILEVMAKREQEHPTGRMSDVDQAWRDFQQYYQTEEGQGQTLHYVESTAANSNRPQENKPASRHPYRSNHVRLRRTLIAAVLVALLIAATTIPVSGYDSVIQMVAKWTAEQFYFTASGSPQRQSQTENAAPVPDEFVELQEALAERGISQLLVPRDIPEGFEIIENSFYPFDGNQITSFTTYISGNDTILFDVIWTQTDSHYNYEKDDCEVEEFDINGIKHYYFTNRSQHNVVWFIDGVEYSLGTSLPKENLMDMVNSMYEV